jgi:glycosyltransferase involved in cell wall biosynthesis
VASKTKHRDIRFLCFGTGAEKEMLEQRAKNEELSNVRFCGLIEHSKVYSVLSHAMVSFIPLKSGRMKDSVPSKIFEALGIGCPVFLAASGEAAELVSETGAGRSVSPDEPDKIVEAFDDMIDHYSEYEAHRKKAIRLMHEKYSRQKYSRDFIRRLHQFCGK